jgi:hypothetical protein
MRVVIAGSRSIDSYYQVHLAIKESGFEIDTIISGTAAGVDLQGEAYGKEHDIPVERYPADWKTHGKKAGFIRNAEMNNVSDATIVVWDGSSNGSKMMAEITERSNKPVYVKRVLTPKEAL